MSAIGRAWRNWNGCRQLAKHGKKTRFIGKNFEIDGHVECGDYCRFRDNIRMRVRGDGKIVFGDRCGVSWNVIMECYERIEVHDGAGIADGCVLRDSAHLMYGTTKSWRHTPTIVKPIIIGEEAFLGTRAYIRYGVTIGKGAVIGINSYVMCDVPPYEVWAGTPARFIRHRTDDLPEEIAERSARLLNEEGLREDRREW